MRVHQALTNPTCRIATVDGTCGFCRKLAGPDAFAAEDVVWHFPHSVAILGLWQFYQGYTVLVARTHASELSQLAPPIRMAYLEEMCVLARAIEAAFQPRKLNYELLGNQVPHLHWHLFPRASEDPEHLQPVWIALDRAERDPDEKARLQQPRLPLNRSATVARLQQHLSTLAGSME
jgi:diadenosine tetraphosphate (Ap4A) HIT family hydrolase